MSDPVVSVIVPAYNRKTLLPRALDSIVSQTFGDWEIVLVDDGSTDGTRELAARYAVMLENRFTYLYQPNRGSSRARNHGIDACRGRYVTFLDSDDEFLPEKLERQLTLFKLRPELGFVYCDYGFVDLDGARQHSSFDTKHPIAREVSVKEVAPGLYACGDDLFDVLLRGYFICTIVGMVRREVLGSAIRFPEDQDFGEEWLFYLKVARACRAGFVDEPLAVYHYNTGSLARTDKQRNARRYRELLKAIHNAFDDLTAGQRRTVQENLARLCRSLGHNAYRAECYGQAFAHFAESFRYLPRVCTLLEGIEAAALWSFAPLAKTRGQRRSQDAAEAVR